MSGYDIYFQMNEDCQLGEGLDLFFCFASVSDSRLLADELTLT
jgi:hypothetical protein